MSPFNTNTIVIGADEVGFGAIAGPLVVCAAASLSCTRAPVLKHYGFENKRKTAIRDSKQLTYNTLLRFRELLLAPTKLLSYELCEISAVRIDTLGAEAARQDAFRSAIWRLLERLNQLHPAQVQGKKYKVIIDGETGLGPNCPFTYSAFARADEAIWQVSAASILAKYHQIQALQRLHELYPQYNWAKNRGYPTAEHLLLLAHHGVSKYHRKSYRPVRVVWENHSKKRVPHVLE